MSVLASSVSAVIVFQRGAVVTRVARARSRAGSVVLAGLPLCLDDESVRIELGPAAIAAGWSVTDVQVEVDAPVQEQVPEPKDEAALAEAHDASHRAQGRLTETLASIEALRAVELRPRVSEDKDRWPAHDPTQGRLDWLAMQSETLAELQATLAQQRIALEQAEEARRVALDDRRAASSDRDPRTFEPRKQVTLSMAEGAEVEDVSIELTYRVPGARWAPSYTLRIEDDAQAKLELRAVVAQQTGEDWSGAVLTVSTASWQAWHDLPRLDALRVGRTQAPVARAGWRELPPDPEGMYADHDRVVATLEASSSYGAVMLGRAPPMPKMRSAARRARPAMAPPVPQGMLAPQPSSMVSGFGGESMPPPAAAPAPARMSKKLGAMQRSSVGMSDAGADDELGESDAFLDEEPVLAPEADEPLLGLARSWFDYGRLRLPMPWESKRGRLRRVDVVSSSGAELGPLAELVSMATDRAGRFSCSPPAGHAWIEGWPGHAYAYVCEALVNIPSDGQTHVVSVLEAVVETSRTHVCVPGISADVFRTLAARSSLSLPLPAGPIDVYERDTFLLTASLDATGAGARFEVGLGVEQAIKVARNVGFSEESEGLIKKHNAYTHHIAIDVQNLLPVPVSIEVRERVPVAASDEADIEVSESAVDPPWDHHKPKDDPLEGGRRWRIDLAAGAKTSLAATWTVRVPGGSELVDGNRRDA